MYKAIFLWCIAVAYASLVVDMKASWPKYTPQSLLQEFSEYHEDDFWNFIQHLHNQTYSSSLLDLLSSSSTEAEVMKLSLVNREFAPRIELHSSLERYHRDLYKLTCSPLFVLKDSASCNLQDIKLESLSSETPYNFDHVYNPAASKTLIVYANIVDAKFKETNESLKRLSYELDFKYILRHTDLRNKSELDTVGGWGIELLIKNMDYKPVEDFEYLSHESLPEEDISLETAYLLLETVKQGDWAKATDLINNWPSNINNFLDSDPPYEYYKEAVENSNYFYQNSIDYLLLINGHPCFDSFFFVLPTIRNEIKSFGYLTSLGLSNRTATSVLKHCNTKAHMYKPNGGVFNMSDSGRIFINDLEVDSYYKSWSRDPSSFLDHYHSALNWLNLYVVVDLNSETSIHALNSLGILYRKMYPIRMSLIVLGETRVANSFSIALNMLRKHGEDLVYDFFLLIRYPITEDNIRETAEILCRECNLELDISSLLKSKGKDFCKDTGICGPASFLLNGRLLEIENYILQTYNFLEVIDKELPYEKKTIFASITEERLKEPIVKNIEEGNHGRKSYRYNSYITHTELKEFDLIYPIPKCQSCQIFGNAQGLLTFNLAIYQNNTHIIQLTTELFERFPDLSLRVRVIDIEKYSERVFKEECIVVNSRVIPTKYLLHYLDLKLLYDTEMSRLGIEALSSVVLQDKWNKSDVIEEIASRVIKNLKEMVHFKTYEKYPIPKGINKEYTGAVSKRYGVLDVQLLINPMSEVGHDMLNIGDILYSIGADIQLIVYAKRYLHQHLRWYIPALKREFNSPIEIFINTNHTVTIKPIILETWQVSLIEGPKDMDNYNLKNSAHITYKLDYILSTGQCLETMQGQSLGPPNGLQLVLKGLNNKVIDDTIVMKNLGYFQFKTKPGVYHIALAKGRSKELFNIILDSNLIIKDMIGGYSSLVVEKKPHKINEKLLGTKEDITLTETIHIFSMASGSLYERFLRIMMLSAVRNTSAPIKFWLIEDFLSQSFKDELPDYCKFIGCDYELVSYRWPVWLFTQKEKNRIIWAYKILFLDVLFPINLPRVIYIDADQVIRSDLKELWTMDLQGAAYGFIPFCSKNANLDTMYLRNWEEGFWSDYLKDKPYHFSALYVVDLVTFKSLAAGDILRYLYNSLVPDPKNLLCLDLDLANFAQYTIPIYSLPQEWLWCETWCDLESKSKAKSIDLCSNPHTKEPKISSAKRIIPEWLDYDSEIDRNLSYKEYTKPNKKEEL